MVCVWWGRGWYSYLFWIHRLGPSIHCLSKKYKEEQAYPKNILNFSNPQRCSHPVHWRLGPFKVSIFLLPYFYWTMLRAYTNDILCINYACIMCLLYYARDVNVFFKTFSITWQQISCHYLHPNVFPTWRPVYVVIISNESVHKGNLRSYKLMFKFDVYCYQLLLIRKSL